MYLLTPRPVSTLSVRRVLRSQQKNRTLTMTLRLRIVHGKPNGTQLSFDRGEYLFGRGAECHVRPNSEWVSRQHCLLRVTPEAAWLRDLGSPTGTLVNGVRLLREQLLAQGDLVEVGPLVFEVQIDTMLNL
jgi:pSer/pThr/pTyr-binding forkhead associated (FHA) protein